MNVDIKTLAHELIQWGIDHQAQDLYILPKREIMEVFFRYSKSKVIFKELPLQEGEKLIFHFKFISGMDVGERRKMQMGAVEYQVKKQQRRLRLSTVGDYQNRESLVIRFLHAFGEEPEYFFLPWQVAAIKAYSHRKGLHVFSGPVGSGKTTFMYKIAKQITHDQQVISIEDPVEIEEATFLQLQTNEKIAVTYEALIRACLRHRPDVLIIGEIRDRQTAQAAIRAALTGHTVFTTIHARNIVGVWQRLKDLGSDLSELSECLAGIIYQRLLPETNNEKARAGVLFDYCFQWETTPVGKWNNFLRKVWAYGFISDQVFYEEQDQVIKN